MRARSLPALLVTALGMVFTTPSSVLFGCDVLPCHEERADLGEVFRAFGVEGTFVLTEAGTERGVVYNSRRAARPYPPASTFKIANSLIALETGAVKDENEIIPYGGRPQRFPAWEHDMSMREAIAISAVPIYQEIARRVGTDRMREWVRRLAYGNGEIGTAVDRFWLDGPLAIDATGQTIFLARFATGRFASSGVSERSLGIVKRILLTEARDASWLCPLSTPLVLLRRCTSARLYGKTGWLFDASPQIGWWVGWIERGGEVRSFALNIDIKTPEDANKRVALGRALLAKLGAW